VGQCTAFSCCAIAIAFRHDFVEQVRATGIKQVLSAPRPPWQRAYVERVIVFNEASLSRHLQAFIGYYDRTRTHHVRSVQPPEGGRIISIPEVGGLHHRMNGISLETNLITSAPSRWPWFCRG
jgi:hypothetical protein